jgi:hypothetical protein
MYDDFESGDFGCAKVSRWIQPTFDDLDETGVFPNVDQNLWDVICDRPESCRQAGRNYYDFHKIPSRMQDEPFVQSYHKWLYNGIHFIV